MRSSNPCRVRRLISDRRVGKERRVMRLFRMAPAALAVIAMMAGVPFPAEPYEAVAVRDGGPTKGGGPFREGRPTSGRDIPPKAREAAGTGPPGVTRFLTGPAT